VSTPPVSPETVDRAEYTRKSVATRHSVLQHDTPSCNTTFRLATRHSVLQHDTPRCNTTLRLATRHSVPATRHSVLQHDIPSCNTTLRSCNTTLRSCNTTLRLARRCFYVGHQDALPQMCPCALRLLQPTALVCGTHPPIECATGPFHLASLQINFSAQLLSS
jgi:hypothetical protein